MKNPIALCLDACMNHCLAAIIAVGRDDALAPAARRRVLAKLADIAHGVERPRAEDDSLAAQLAALDAALREHPLARDAWRARVRGAVVAASSGDLMFARAA